MGQYEKGMDRIHALLGYDFPRTANSRVRPNRRLSSVGGVNGDGPSIDPRHAGAELRVLSLLRGAEKHVPMIDDAVDLENRQGAKAAFSALAVINHADIGFLERIKDRLVRVDRDFLAQSRNPDDEWDGWMLAAVAECFEPQAVHRPTGLSPAPFGRFQHPDRTADIEFALRVEARNLGGDVDARSILAQEQLETIPEPLRKLVARARSLRLLQA
jgi:hypothetical protein